MLAAVLNSPKAVFAMSKIRTKLACAAASLMMAGFGLPAHAATEPQQKVCNSINSVTIIRVYTISGGSWTYDLGRGTCVTGPNGNNRLRVDVDPDCFGCTDVDSYYIGQEGEGYGPCHQGENNASDPPNIDPRYDKYNTNAGSC